MHILHVIDSLGLGGAERMAVDLANASVRDGHRVAICVTRGDVTLAPELDPRVELFVLGRMRRFSVRDAVRFGMWVRHRAFDLAHVHMRHTLTFVLAARVTGAMPLPIVFHDHYGTIETDSSIPLWFRIGHRAVARYVGVYEKLEEWAQLAGMPAARTATIGNAIDLKRIASAQPLDLRAELRVPEHVTLGIVVATIRRDKGLETLVEAVARSRHRERLCIAVVGAETEPDYGDFVRGRIREHGLDRTIRLLGGRTDVPRLLPAADFAALSSHTESGPLVLVEYLAAGLPIVSTEVGQIGRRLAQLGVPGFVPAANPAAFAAELDRMLDLSLADRSTRAREGARLISTHLDITSAMPRWYALYEAVLAERKQRRFW